MGKACAQAPTNVQGLQLMLLAGDYNEHLGTSPFSYHCSPSLRNQAVEDQRLLHGAFTWTQTELGCLGL